MEEETILPADSTETSSTMEDEVELTGCAATACCNPRSSCHRFMALAFMCLLGFGSYFCYDNPAALQDDFEKDLNLSKHDFGLLYSVYSWPNVILCFIGGFLIDSVFGIALGTNIYMLIVLIGQLIFASGAFYDAYWLMLVGRFVFGCGAESLAVAQNNYAVMWFKGRELNMVFGLQLSFARLGSTVNFLTMQYVYNEVQKYLKGTQIIGIVLFIATLTCIMSMICSLILGWMNNRADRLLHRNQNNTEVARLSDVKDFKWSFWIVSLIILFYYISIFPFIAYGQVFFKKKFHLSSQAANTVNSMVYLISAFASPFLGLLIDKVGRNILWVILSIGCTIGAHALLNFTEINPYISMTVMGIAYSLCASGLWPLISLIIPEYQLGTAYGICQAVQNAGLAIVTMAAGAIIDKWGYYWVEIAFITFLSLALFFTIMVWIMDSRGVGIMNMTPYEREVHLCNRQAAEILEREKLLSSSRSQIGPNDLLQPTNSEFHIRNRYLSRIGAPLPSHYNVNQKYLAYRTLR